MNKYQTEGFNSLLKGIKKAQNPYIGEIAKDWDTGWDMAKERFAMSDNPNRVVISIESAQKAGRDAFLSEAKNPFIEDSDSWRSWNYGFVSAKREYMDSWGAID